MSKLPEAKLRENVPAILESPALYRDSASTPAYEIKFLLTEVQARALEARLLPRLTLDPHADASLGNAYRVTSVYCDTSDYRVYDRAKGYRRNKFRVRRYGFSEQVYLERKTKSRQQVRKQRTAAPLEDLDMLAGAPSPDWPGLWFIQQLDNRGLKPVCRVSYLRRAFIGACHDGPIRATFDRCALGQTTATAIPEPVVDGHALLRDEVIVELKFLGAMPMLFRAAIEALQLAPQSVSKYRRCVEATGQVPSGVKQNA